MKILIDEENDGLYQWPIKNGDANRDRTLTPGLPRPLAGARGLAMTM